jgi:hypothetical protein
MLLHTSKSAIKRAVPGGAVLVDVLHVLRQGVAVPFIDAADVHLHGRRQNVGLEREERFGCPPHAHTIAQVPAI